MAGGGLQVSWRGGGRHRWAQSCRMPGARGSAALGWASVSWEKAAELDCELRPSWA